MTCRTLVVMVLFLASLLVPFRAHGDEAPPPRERPSDKPRDNLELGALGGVGFPHPLAIEAAVRLRSTLLVGLEYGVLPRLTFGEVSTSLWSLAGDVRVFPFKGAFFLGLRAGYQSLSAGATLTADNLGSYTESMVMKTWFVNPRIGFLWTWKPLVLGIDAGIQVPITTTVSRSTLLALADPALDARVTRAADALGRTPLPTIDLIRIGVMF